MSRMLLALALVAAAARAQHPSFTLFASSSGRVAQQTFDPFGHAHGLYSYVNPDGQVVSVRYNTGGRPANPFSALPFLPGGFRASAGNATEILGKELFTAAVVQYPAASAGQVENYRRALEQERNATDGRKDAEAAAVSGLKLAGAFSESNYFRYSK